MQSIIVTVIIVASIGYVMWYVYHILTQKEAPCAGCQKCELKGKIAHKCQCPYKK